MSEATQYSCAVIIPALNPGAELPGYVQTLLARGIPAVIVVDDGSRADCAPIFTALEEIPGTHVLHHQVNPFVNALDEFLTVPKNSVFLDVEVALDGVAAAERGERLPSLVTDL